VEIIVRYWCFIIPRQHGDRVSSGVCNFVCVCVRALKGKRLELSTPDLVHVYSMAVAQHSLTGRSKGQRSRSQGYKNRHGRIAASEVCCFCRRGTARRMTARVFSFRLYRHCTVACTDTAAVERVFSTKS